MAYTHTTFIQARQLIANRLGDSTFIFWTDPELGRYLIDALRHWNLLAQYTKDKDGFPTVSGTAFYSLATEVPAFRSYAATDHELIRIIQHHLMEPISATGWLGTEQFNRTIIIDSLTRRRDRLLIETGCTLQVDTIPTYSPPVDTVPLEEEIIDIRRVAWVDVSGDHHNLHQRDSLSRNFFNPKASFNPGMPESYLTANLPLVSLELSPPSNDAGSLQLVTIRTGAILGHGVLSQPTLLGIPDDFAPTLKWGVLADLLNMERAVDVDRAAYCEARWQEGIDNCKIAPSMYNMEVNGQQVITTSLSELDTFNPEWQNITGQPNTVGAAGFDLIALSPVPDGIYSVTAEVTRKAIIPAADDDYIQIGKEYMDILLDYCVHLATFKQGGETFLSTKPQFESFMAAAQGRNNRLRAQAFYLDDATRQGTREQERRPREMATA